MGLITEIQGLRIVTSNLLDDLERVVRHRNTCACVICMLDRIYCHLLSDARFALVWHEQEIGFMMGKNEKY